MSTKDPAQERQRLVEHYAGLPEESLFQLDADRDSLTDVAREVLAAEIQQRKLSAPVPEPPPSAPAPPSTTPVTPDPPVLEVDEAGLVTIRQFRDMPEALFAKGALDSADIPSWLVDTNMVRLDWFISNLLGGIKLRVKAEDADEALAILDQEIPPSFEVEGVGEYEQPRCPKCGSVDISFDGINKPLSYGSAYLGVPIPFPSNVWKCESCGQHWKEVADPEQVDQE